MLEDKKFIPQMFVKFGYWQKIETGPSLFVMYKIKIKHIQDVNSKTKNKINLL